MAGLAPFFQPLSQILFDAKSLGCDADGHVIRTRTGIEKLMPDFLAHRFPKLPDDGVGYRMIHGYLSLLDGRQKQANLRAGVNQENTLDARLPLPEDFGQFKFEAM